MAAATAERQQALPSFVTPVGQFSVEDPELHDFRRVFRFLRLASVAAVQSSAEIPGKHVHVFDDRGRVVGWARDGVWHGAVA